VQWLDQCTGMRATAVIARQAYYEKAPRDLESRGASAAPMRAAGFEPTTSCSGGKRSIQLSYARRTLRDTAVAGTAPEPYNLTPRWGRHKQRPTTYPSG
jgi:hypothetical protein